MDETSKDPNVTTLAVDSDLIGLQGQPLRLVIRRMRSESGNAEQLAEGKRTFKVTFTLSRPGEALSPDKTLPNSDLLSGNSYLRLRASDLPQEPFPEVEFPVLTDDGLFKIRELVNPQGFLGKLEVSAVKAGGFLEAERIARKLLIPSISWYATHLDTPLNIYQVDIKDLQTEDFMVYRAMKPYEAVVIPQGIRVFDIKEEAGAYAAIYREALCSNSHVYQFLCFYKIIDGISRRRVRLKQQARSRGEVFSGYSERVPKDVGELIELLTHLFSVEFHWDEVEAQSVFPRRFWGKKITDIVDKNLRPLRNEVAHAFLDTVEIPNCFDDLVNFPEVATLLPMTKCFARWMLKTEFPAQFPSSGRLKDFARP